ncbi:MAG: hypothetical protein ACKPKO_17845 [Candidatus Fonsibacter sp.]
MWCCHITRCNGFLCGDIPFLLIVDEGLFIGDSVTPIATINKNGNITTQGTLTSGNLTAPHIYTKTEVDGLLSPKADKTYVDTQLALKANQSTTYTKTEVITELSKKTNTTNLNVGLALKHNKTYVKTISTKSQPINLIH